MQITIVGNICIDRNTVEKTQYVSAGGPAIFMDKVFRATKDVSAIIVAPVGKDFADFQKDLPIFTQAKLPAKTLVYENVVTNGKRVQKAHNRKFAKPLALTKELTTLLAKTDILLFSPLLPNVAPAYVKTLVALTKKSCLKVLLPQGYYRKFDKENIVHVRKFVEAPQILPLFNIVIFSEEDTKNAKQTAQKWAATYDVLCLVTTGKNGAMAFTKNKEVILPTHPVDTTEIVDSTGSGDIFSACFAYCYKKTGDMQKSGAFANTIARQCLFFSPDTIQINLPKID